MLKPSLRLLPALVLSLSCGGDGDPAGSTPSKSTSAAATAGPAQTSLADSTATAKDAPPEGSIAAVYEDPNRPDAFKPLSTEEVEDAEKDDVQGEAETNAGDTECAQNLKAIQDAVKNSGYPDEPMPIDAWTPDDSPGSESRKWIPPAEFEDLWGTPEPIFGSYRVLVDGADFTAECKTDLDEDGVVAIWTIGKSGEPSRSTPEGTR